MIPITQQQLNELKLSRKHAEEMFKNYRLKGWPKSITTEPGKHFLVQVTK